MKRLLLAAIALCCVSMSAQTINPNQIRPSTTNGQVLTTVSGQTAWAPFSGGAVFPGTNGLVVNTSTSASRTGVANDVMTTLGTPQGLQVFGDSIGYGQGPPNISLGFVNLLKPQIGGQFYNYAVIGNLCINVNQALVSNVNNLPGTPNVMNECGTNDVTQYNTSTNLQIVFQRIVTGNLLFGALPQANLSYAQTCTKTTGFANIDNTHRYGMGQYTVLSGDVLTCHVTTTSNGEVALGWLISNAGTGTFTLSINGSSQTDPLTSSTTFLSYPDGSTSMSGGTAATSAVVGQVFSGFPANTSVAVVFTSTAASTTAAPVEIDYVASVPSTLPANEVIVVSPNHQNNANDTLSGVYAGYELAIQTALRTAGLNVVYDNTRDALGTNFATYYADTIHPNQAGAALMDTTTEAAVPNLITGAPTNLFNSSGFTYPPNAAVPPTPATWWTPNPTNALGDGSTTWTIGGINLGGKSSGLGLVFMDNIHGATLAGPSNGSQASASLCSYNATFYAYAPSLLGNYCPVYIGSNNLAVIGGRSSDGKGGLIGAGGDVIVNSSSETSGFGAIGNAYFGGAGTYFLPQNAGSFSPAVSYPSVPTYWGINGCTSSSACGTVFTGWQAVNTAGNSPTSYLTLVNKQSTSLPFALDVSTSTTPNKLGNVILTSSTTATNCSSAASPAVCGSAMAGSVVIATAATTVVVNSTAVTANSQIFVIPDESLGTKLGVTCNNTAAVALAAYGVTARTAGTSFTLTTTGTVATNPACYSYLIVN